MTVREEIIRLKRPPITFTPEEAIAILNSLEPGNTLEAHSIADDASLRVLSRLGGHEIVAAFRAAEDRCGFWDEAIES
ncbi:hypothetical protein [Mesoterricola silvestris]|uniref:Uncharacterized protein n=1 Tax=Mesoterricola silvestris TaxID=2927979 RepID=A0AA48K7W1_9BACT|nr:hypothetical protein [Mesoterricola silvestris]BDU72319.1 hypothetical protein METEAL_14930 [Mesoterricola silvestris]